MLTYCLGCKKNTKNKCAKMMKTNGIFVLSSNCATCGSRRSTFTKEQEAEGLLSNLGTPFSKIPLLNVLF